MQLLSTVIIAGHTIYEWLIRDNSDSIVGVLKCDRTEVEQTGGIINTVTPILSYEFIILLSHSINEEFILFFVA